MQLCLKTDSLTPSEEHPTTQTPQNSTSPNAQPKPCLRCCCRPAHTPVCTSVASSSQSRTVAQVIKPSDPKPLMGSCTLSEHRHPAAAAHGAAGPAVNMATAAAAKHRPCRNAVGYAAKGPPNESWLAQPHRCNVCAHCAAAPRPSLGSPASCCPVHEHQQHSQSASQTAQTALPSIGSAGCHSSRECGRCYRRLLLLHTHRAERKQQHAQSSIAHDFNHKSQRDRLPDPNKICASRVVHALSRLLLSTH